jgi:hypothetical protein
MESGIDIGSLWESSSGRPNNALSSFAKKIRKVMAEILL